MNAILTQNQRDLAGMTEGGAPVRAGAAGAADTGTRPSRRALWTGRVLSGLAVLFLTFDATLKLLRVPEAIESTGQLGYPANTLFGIGVIQVICLIAYLVPRSAVLGAVLWTGYLGGAIATHVRVGNPLFSHTLFPIYVALLLWGGLWLREPRLSALLPLRSRQR
jgi:DoxX-like protein